MDMRNNEFTDSLSKKRVFVTGATGLVGSVLVRSLFGMDAEVIALIRNPEKAREIYKEDADKIRWIVGDVTDSNSFLPISGDVDYVFHCAAVTASKTMISSPVETIRTAVAGTDHVLSFSVKHHVKTFLYISSMEVYGTMPEGVIATEDKLGFINLSAVRSNYPESKRLCENLCIAYKEEYGLDICIARLAQTFGPGVLPWDHRVFAQFAESALKKTDIVLHTEGKSEGNYCDTEDMVRGLYTILFRGRPGESYNVVNEETHTTIAGMAHMVAHDIAQDSIRVVFDIPQENVYGYAAETHLTLSGQKLMSLGWKPQYNLKEMYLRMMNEMRNREDFSDS